MQKAGNVLLRFRSLGPLFFLIQIYLYFNPVAIQFQVLSQRSVSFMSLKREETVFEAGSIPEAVDGVDATARSLSPDVDEVI